MGPVWHAAPGIRPRAATASFPGGKIKAKGLIRRSTGRTGKWDAYTPRHSPAAPKPVPSHSTTRTARASPPAIRADRGPSQEHGFGRFTTGGGSLGNYSHKCRTR